MDKHSKGWHTIMMFVFLVVGLTIIDRSSVWLFLLILYVGFEILFVVIDIYRIFGPTHTTMTAEEFKKLFEDEPKEEANKADNTEG